MAMPFLPPLFALLLMAGPALAAVIPESCTDGRGREIAIETDYAQEQLVRTELLNQVPVIRYNPRVLTQMARSARLFFVAYTCARADATATRPTATLAHRADCAAYRMLKVNGLLGESELADLPRQLVFTTAEWEKLPGPPRTFDFSDCAAQGNVLRLPLATPPSDAQANWNACAHACGDRLWHCQRGGADGACLGAYDACLKSCGTPPAATR